MIRRFICTSISTVASLVVCAFILPIKRWNMSYLLSAYGICSHHTLEEAVVFPLCLTSLMYIVFSKFYQFGARGPNMGTTR
ncbi:hypothetical protein HanPI659440_Chr01g0031791 [Helianthus annuus]|nr:hypothetical protein HanPI659440_Chr01g0031791 [Helianthus annuus]